MGVAFPGHLLVLFVLCLDGSLSRERDDLATEPYRHELPPIAERRLTDWPGNENNPRFSPDGTWLAFDAEVGGWTDLYLLSMSNGEVRRLTSSPQSDRRPAWSPDGRTLAFQSNRTGTWAIWSVDVRGGDPRLLFGDETLQAIAPDWSPGGRLVATVIRPDPSRAYGHVAPWILPRGENPARALTSGGDEWFARWIADTEEVVYYKGKDDEIEAVDAATGRIRSLSGGEFVGWRPVVSPDGSSLAFASNIGRWRPSLWLSAMADPPRLVRLTAGSNDDMPSWSPDGRWIAYSSDRSSLSIVALDVATRARSTVVSEAAAPEPLSDGRLAYLADTPQGWRLAIARPDSGPLAHLFTLPPGIAEFAFSRSGDQVAYVASGVVPRHDFDLYLAPLDGGSPSRLTELGDAEHPVWCEDGSLLFSSYGPTNEPFRQIWRLEPALRSLTQISRSRSDKAALQCDSAGARITARWTSDSTGIYLLERRGSDWTERELVNATEGTWSPDGGGFAYVASVDGQTDLFLRTTDGEVERLTDDLLVEREPRWSADGCRLLFTVGSGQRDLWMVAAPEPIRSPASERSRGASS